MPQSRKRAGNHPYKQQADIPASQRVKGRIMWAILCAIFAFLFAYFGAGENYLVLSLATIAGAVIGFFIGKAMEQDA
jgi:hypothetical protein